MAEDFDGFVGAAWSDHTDAPQAVADRLAASMHLVAGAAQVAPYAALLVHVHGVHLAGWECGQEQLAALRRARGYDGTAVTEGPIARGIAALAIASGQTTAADALEVPDRIAALAQASAALLDREEAEPGSIARAIVHFEAAARLAADHQLPDGSPALRSLAVGGNNLAAVLEERSTRSPAQTDSMLLAARTGLACWLRCGGWLEHERAQYRMARSLLRAGRGAEATAHARQCVQICETNEAPAFERFFGHAVESLALQAAGCAQAASQAKARAMAAYEVIPVDERSWCADDLRELQSTGIAGT
jgi:hypothetical protein